MAAQVELRWMGTSASRAPRIHQKRWEAHEAELLHLYKDEGRTIDEVVQIMGKRGFLAT
jgi:hypothetical protein